MRESAIEKKVSDYAKKLGMLSYKFTSPAKRAVPDRIYLWKGAVFFIEFKAPGRQVTKLQRHEINRISSEDIPVYVVDDVAQGIGVIDERFFSAL